MRLRLTPACLLAALLATTAATRAAAAPFAALHRGDYDQVRGTWLLQDGRRIQLAGSARHPRLELGDGRSLPLRAGSPLDYETPDGCLSLRFGADANGLVSRLQLSQARLSATGDDCSPP